MTPVKKAIPYLAQGSYFSVHPVRYGNGRGTRKGNCTASQKIPKNGFMGGSGAEYITYLFANNTGTGSAFEALENSELRMLFRSRGSPPIRSF